MKRYRGQRNNCGLTWGGFLSISWVALESEPQLAEKIAKPYYPGGYPKKGPNDSAYHADDNLVLVTTSGNLWSWVTWAGRVPM